MSTRPPAPVTHFRDARRTRAEHQTLCRSGFHQWQVETDGHFDVQAGKLRTVERCRRGGAQRIKLR